MQDEFQTRLTIDGFVVADGRRRGVQLRVDQDGVETDDGIRVDWRRAKLRRDEADQAILVVGKEATVGSIDAGFLRSLESAAGNDLDRELARLQGLRTGVKGSQAAGCILFFALAVWLIGSIPGCYSSAVTTAIASLPYSVDEELGKVAQDSMEVGPEVDDEVVIAAVEAMVERLNDFFEDTDVPPSEVEWSVRVVESDQVNAFALPGGYITVYTALIAEAENADMVAGVVAHEMAHVLERHGLERIGNQLGLFAGLQLLIGNTGGLIAIAGELLVVAIGSEWSRDQETEADVVGTKAMVRAGLDAKALGDFFRLLERKYGDTPSALSWLATHPSHATRVEEIEELVETLEGVESRPLELDWEDVRARVGDGD
ncbi:MAG: M48 family metallopeptidase [Planctomycetota bacterium]